jgi:isopenicillin N synthase-like dioxygenase
MLELWTGGAFTAVVHRVVNRSGRERYSSAFFRANAMDTVCRPLLAPTDVQPKAGSNNASSSGNAVVDCVLDELRPVRVGSVYNALPFYRIGDGSVTAASVVQAAA